MTDDNGFPIEQNFALRLWGRKMMACVKLKEGVTCTEEEILAFCRKNLPRFKVPKVIEFVDEFPTTLTGKILRRKLREQYANKV